MKTTFSVFLIATLTVACTAGAQVAPDEHNHEPAPPEAQTTTPREQIEFLLSAYHGLPGRAELEAIEGAQSLLWQIVEDADTVALFRERALLSLGYWPDAPLRAWLENMLRHATGAVLLEHDALLLYASRFDDEAAAAIIAPLLQAHDIQLGLTAVEALRTMQSPGAAAILRATTTSELAEPVRAAINEAIGQ
jgi:hypothetical protein